MSLIIAVLLNIQAGVAVAEQCPPGFYVSLPRDNDWYYGAGKGIDPEQARNDALRHLGKQVTGDLDYWEKTDIEKLAGPGQDRITVSEEVGDLLPDSAIKGVFQGWEQDDRAQCKEGYYAMVRVQKDKVDRFIRENRKFKDSLLEGLAKRLKQAEQDIRLLQADLPRMRSMMEALGRKVEEQDRVIAKLQSKPQSGAPVEQLTMDNLVLRKQVSDIRSDIAHKRPSREIATKLVAAEGAYKQLVQRMQQYEQRHSQMLAENAATADAERKKRREQLATKIHAWMSSGTLKFRVLKSYYAYQHRYYYWKRYGYFPSSHATEDHVCGDVIMGIIRYDGDAGRYQLLRDFSRNVLAKFRSDEIISCKIMREYAAAEMVRASLLLGDREALLKDGEAYLRDFPTGKSFNQVKEYMTSEMQSSQAPPAPNGHSADSQDSLDAALIQAVEDEQLNSVRGLLDKGANVDATNKGGFPAVVIAAVKGNVALVEVLVGRGADVSSKAYIAGMRRVCSSSYYTSHHASYHDCNMLRKTLSESRRRRHR